MFSIVVGALNPKSYVLLLTNVPITDQSSNGMVNSEALCLSTDQLVVNNIFSMLAALGNKAGYILLLFGSISVT